MRNSMYNKKHIHKILIFSDEHSVKHIKDVTEGATGNFHELSGISQVNLTLLDETLETLFIGP